jgi:hypothetical protein
MFSGIIENKGFVLKFEKQKDFRLVLDTNLKSFCFSNLRTKPLFSIIPENI